MKSTLEVSTEETVFVQFLIASLQETHPLAQVEVQSLANITTVLSQTILPEILVVECKAKCPIFFLMLMLRPPE